MHESLVVEGRFNGPPDSANGGFACGLFATRAAALLGEGDLAVTLHEPPPLDVPLGVQATGRRVGVWCGETLVATVSRTEARIEVIPFVDPAVAAEAASAYPGRSAHPFPTCFVCGPQRPDADGLALSPGRLPGAGDVTACVWNAEESFGSRGETVPAELAWAVLDCPGGWTADLSQRPMVLARFTARFPDGLPRVGDRHVVLGRLDAFGKRTMNTTTTLYRADGALLGQAQAVWSFFD